MPMFSTIVAEPTKRYLNNLGDPTRMQEFRWKPFSLTPSRSYCSVLDSRPLQRTQRVQNITLTISCRRVVGHA